MLKECEDIVAQSQTTGPLKKKMDDAVAQGASQEAAQAAEIMAQEAQDSGDALLSSCAKVLSFEPRLASGDAEEAVQAVQEAVAHFKGLGDLKKAAVAMCLIAKAVGAYDATEVGEQALMIFRQVQDPTGQAAALLIMSNGLLAAGEFDKAAYRAEQAANIYRQAGDVSQEAGAMRTTALAHLEKLKYKPKAALQAGREAVRFATAALKLYEGVGETASASYAAALQTVAAAHLPGGSADKALDRAEMAKQLYETLEDVAGQARSLNTIAQAMFDKGEPIDAMNAAGEARELFKESGDAYSAAVSSDLIEKFKAGEGKALEGAANGDEEESGKKKKKGAIIDEPKTNKEKSDVWHIDHAEVFAFWDAYHVRSATVAGARPTSTATQKEDAKVSGMPLQPGLPKDVVYKVSFTGKSYDPSWTPPPKKETVVDQVYKDIEVRPGDGSPAILKADGRRRGEFPLMTRQRFTATASELRLLQKI